MQVVAHHLLPAHAELARRAAGGDGAAFVRLYDAYSEEVFAMALAATRSVDDAAEATQRAFLRLLRWPPRLAAPDGDVAELLFALALGGTTARENAPPSSPEDHAVARLVGVGWLRSETVAKAGARYDADWSVHLWTPDSVEPAEPSPPEPAPKRRLRLVPPLKLNLPSPAAVAAVLLLLLTGLVGSLMIESGPDSVQSSAPAAAAPDRSDSAERGVQADARNARRTRSSRTGRAEVMRERELKPLLAP